MSRFISPRYTDLVPYIPGEQPKDPDIIKLNANETSMPPSPRVLAVLKSERMRHLGRYTDPSSMELKTALSRRYAVRTSEVLVGNGSDEILGLIFLTFFEQARIAYPDVTYGFYRTMARSFGIDHAEIPLRADFTVDVDAYVHSDRHIVLANPNAPTGYVLPVSEIERIVAANPQRLVVIDEAYVDYGNESCVPLIHKYDNLLVVQTMSKSRNLAGAHIGYCFGAASLIKDLEGMKAAFNPFNLSDVSMAIGTASVEDEAYFEHCVKETIAAREYTKEALRQLGFYVMDSHTNFVFVTHPWLTAEAYNAQLRAHGIIARHYPDDPRVSNFLRITIGTCEEMEAVIAATKEILCQLAA